MLIKIVQIEARVEWKCFRTKSGNWIGVCDPLKLSLQSETWASLLEDISQSLDAILKDLLHTGDFERFLQDHGWRNINAIPAVRPSRLRFDVPFSAIPQMDAYGSAPAIH